MNSRDPLSRVFVVLSRPRYGGNVGAAARVVKNMGLGGLVVAGSEGEPGSEAAEMAAEAGMMASGARDVLDSARRCGNLGEALAPFEYSFAATRRVRSGRSRIMTPREAAEFLRRELGNRRAALVFGPEDSGLTAAETAFCRAVVSIPAEDAYPSLNLAQAVMVLAWEVRMAFVGGGLRVTDVPVAAASEREEVFRQMESALEVSGFFLRNERGRVMVQLREILSGGIRTSQDARILRGVFRRLNQVMRERSKGDPSAGSGRTDESTMRRTGEGATAEMIESANGRKGKKAERRWKDVDATGKGSR